MGIIGKSFTLILILIIVTSSLSLLAIKPVFAQSLYSPTPTPYEQVFSYLFPDGYEFSYEIGQAQDKTDYIIAPLVMDNPYPIEISFYEQLPNGTQNNVTHIFPIHAYGSMYFSTSYPMNITFTELTNQPTPTPTSSINPTTTPTVPEFSWLAILPLLVSMLLVAGAIKRYKHLTTL